MAHSPLHVTVWHEYEHEKTDQAVAELYPDGMHAVMKAAIEEHLGDDAVVRTATLQEPEHGLSEKLLKETDVLTWWGHVAHDQVTDAVVERVHRRVLEGMGLVVLHSAHFSKIFRKLMGAGCGLKWREAGELERLWCVNPAHPIAAGMDKPYFEVQPVEMYGEFFDVPAPDELVFVSWFEGGEVFRSGCVWTRGCGRIFYFRPGHETYPVYYNPDVRRVLANGVRYVAPRPGRAPYSLDAPNVKPLSPIPKRD